MKEYQKPIMEQLSLYSDDMITASGVVDGIVSDSDRNNSYAIQTTTWKGQEWSENWN